MKTALSEKALAVIDLPERQLNSAVNVSVTLQALSSTPKGDSALEGYLSFSNVGKYEYRANGTTNKADQWDINGNGNTAELLPTDTRIITYTPPREVVGVKKVGKTLGSLTPTGTSSLDLGGEFYYGFNILNLQKSDPVRALSILDVLPHINDKAIVPDISGNYVDRGSQYRVEITGPVKLLKYGAEADPEANGYEVLYSTDVPVNGDLTQNLQKSFSKVVTDWSAVTMIKINMLNGTEIAAQAEVNFVVPARVPDDRENIKDNYIAFNSFALAAKNSSDAQLDASSFIEAIRVATPVARYTVSGTIYRDFNQDGAMTVGEKALSGVRVGLYNNDNALIDEATTDTNGFYTFDVITRGSYTVKILEKPAGMEFPDAANHFDDLFPFIATSSDKQQVDGHTVGNDIDNQGVGSFTVDPSKRNARVNAALEDKIISVPVEKQWVGAPAPLDNIVAELHANGQSKELLITQANQWRGEFLHIRQLDETGAVIAYTLTESTALEGFSAAVSGDAESGFLIRNISGESVSINIEKRWVGAQKEILIDILANGEKVRSVTMNSTTGWSTAVNDLPRYDIVTGEELVYTVAGSLTGYKTAISGDAVSGFVIENTEIVKQPPVQTGDASNIGLWLALFAASGAGMLMTAVTFRKRRNKPADK